MKMGLYKLFSSYRSRGFWLKSHSFYEQPTVHFTYEFLLIAETEDPSQPIICGEASILDDEVMNGGENCAEVQIQEHDYNEDGKNDVVDIKFLLNIPPQRTVASVIVFLALDYQLKAACPLHMQSLAVINREFAVPPSGLKYFGDLQLYQVTHLPCTRHHIDTKYNVSLFNYVKDSNENIVDFILQHYFNREVTTETKAIYSRSQNGHNGAMNLDIRLRIPEVEILYRPSLLQELKWAWPQYLSIALIFHWVFNKIKKFVFNNRLLMAWEVIPWKKH
ncbi:transmembrane protein 231 isoform X2 [Pectinophora gossypiella]|uniref:transmembrane protein 231 isoform X2 n=1 Tax=Pectinophora gossypiella TaxID=13191 RepID=UPI00214E0DCB|nr:transmembrane protein 231 isoform X2 [Pectinophora gossypiella]